jgi:hypothetical protein
VPPGGALKIGDNLTDFSVHQLTSDQEKEQ